MNIIGIDPGRSGGIAWLSENDEEAEVYAMPATERDMFDLLWRLIGKGKCRAVIERVHAFPRQGVASTWRFAENYGFLRGCLVGLEIPFESVAAGVWQRRMGCLSKGDKRVTKARAQELWPKLKLTHKTAEALLIAEDTRRRAMT